MVILFPLVAMELAAAIALTASDWPGPVRSCWILLMAAWESEKIVYSLLLSFLPSNYSRAWPMANNSASKTSLFLPSYVPCSFQLPLLLNAIAAPTLLFSRLDPSVHMESTWSFSVQRFAVRRASSFLSTCTSALISLNSSHLWSSAASPRLSPHLSLTRAVSSLFLWVRISSCPPLSMGLESSLRAKEACLWSNSAYAGGRVLTAVMMPTSVVFRTPREALPILFVRTWMSRSSLLVPVHDNSAAYNSVPWIKACWRFLAVAEGMPDFPTIFCTAASALLALLRTLLLLTHRLSDRSSHTPSHLVAFRANGILLAPTWTPSSSLAPLFLDSSRASVFDSSNLTAFCSPQSIHSFAHASSPSLMTLTLGPVTNHVTSSTKKMPAAP